MHVQYNWRSIQLSVTCECKSILFTTIFSYYYAGSPSVTTLTFNGQSRTLTCTSTGGPATTVTWKRDGAVITPNATYQQTKRVVDPVAGTYQTVLTIDPSVDQSDIMGTYNCTVSNARGKSSMLLVVKGENFLPSDITYMSSVMLWTISFVRDCVHNSLRMNVMNKDCRHSTYVTRSFSGFFKWAWGRVSQSTEEHGFLLHVLKL